MNAPTSRPSIFRPRNLVIGALVALVLAYGGYRVGADMAHRDNARAAAAR